MYDSGEIQTEKIKLQNTADNVAYSSAALQARDLNFSAYTNRAMVANQVSMAQMVGLSSYTVFLKRTAENLDTVATLFPPIKAATTPIKEASKNLSVIVDMTASDILIPTTNKTNFFLSDIQHKYHQAITGILTNNNNQVGKLNDPNAISLFTPGGNVTGLLNAARATKQWNEQIGSQNELHNLSDSSSDAQAENARFTEFGQVVRQSRDPFSSKRSYHWFDLNLGAVEITAKKRGGTGLKRAKSNDQYHWDWSAMDTISLYYKVDLGITSIKWNTPIAWGAAHATGVDHTTGRRYEYDDHGNIPGNENADREAAWGGALRNEDAAKAAGEEFETHSVGRVDRLQPFYSFRDDETNHNYGPATMAVYLKNADDISLERNTLDHASSAIDTKTDSGLLNHHISAASKAAPYFARSIDLEAFARRDGRFEYGNLFNPFWQPKLIELTPTEKNIIAEAVAAF